MYLSMRNWFSLCYFVWQLCAFWIHNSSSIFWYFMALICFENPISFCFNQWSLGLVQSVELATPNSLVRSEEAFKGLCIRGTFSFVSFDYVSYIFPQLLIQIAMKFLGLSTCLLDNHCLFKYHSCSIYSCSLLTM